MKRVYQFLFLIPILLCCNREDSKPPKVEFVNPADNSVFYERDTVAITVQASDNDEVFEVKIFIDDIEHYTGHATPYEYKFLTSGKLGDHVIKATASDPSGNTGESKLLLFKVLNNSNPIARFTVSPEMAVKGTGFTFDASGSSDPEDELSKLTFRWDWNDDEIWDTDFKSTVVVTHQYDEPGIFTVLMQVKDRQNNISLATGSVIVKGFFVDPRDGNRYETVLVNGEEWFAQNLRFSSSTGSWCYNSINSNCNEYGRLYNWGSGVNACPEGWHVPSDQEWFTLETFSGMNESELNTFNDRKSGEVGRKMKTRDGWGSSNPGSDSYGLSHIASGYADARGPNTLYLESGESGKLWTASYNGLSEGINRSVSNKTNGVMRGKISMNMGFSVRCIKGVSNPVIGTVGFGEVKTTTATVQGKSFSGGGSAIISQGICWSKNDKPTIQDNHIEGQLILGIFSCQINGLVPNSTYNVRAYASNQTNTAYGEILSMKTAVDMAAVITGKAIDITATTAQCEGEVNYDGYGSIKKRGICWALHMQPTLEDFVLNDSGGIGIYSLLLTNLIPNSTYFYRGFVINEAGTAYGEILSFKTIVGLPVLETKDVVSITRFEATTGGRIISDGGDLITDKGICFNTSGGPNINNDHISRGTGTDEFTLEITGLDVATKYFVRAYAVNSAGTSYGQQIEFTTKNDTGSFIDSRDNQTYTTVKIGNQWWMSKNLNYDGGTSWCYGGDIKNCEIYGRLYNWSTANSVCPVGWHLPTNDDWWVLAGTVGPTAGKHLKSTIGWIGLNGDNSSGFNALPSGQISRSGSFSSIGEIGFFWSSTFDHTSDIGKYYYIFILSGGKDDPTSNSQLVTYGNPVRCLKD